MINRTIVNPLHHFVSDYFSSSFRLICLLFQFRAQRLDDRNAENEEKKIRNYPYEIFMESSITRLEAMISRVKFEGEGGGGGCP